MNTKTSIRRREGFTLVEIMIAVMIIGLLAALALPGFARARERVQMTLFVSDLRTFVHAAEQFVLETGAYPEDSSSGEIPTGLAPFLRSPDAWTGGTPIGGLWDAELNSFGIVSAIGAHVTGGVPAHMLAGIDEMLDDGNLSTGVFRQISGGRYYYVLAE